MNLATAVDAHPGDAPALRTAEGVTTYATLRGQVVRAREILVARGAAPGDRVAIACANTPMFAVSYLAALSLGAIAVPLNPLSPPPELSRLLAVSGATVAVCDDQAAAALEHLSGSSGSSGSPGFSGSPVALRELVRRDDGICVPGTPGAVAIGAQAVGSEDLALLMFTAGTAGPAKAARITHGNLLANLRQLRSDPRTALRHDDVTIVEVPLFHIFGLNVILGMTLMCGASTVLSERFDPAGCLARIAANGVTVLAGVPAMLAVLADQQGAGGDDLAGVRQVLSGAAELDPATARAFEARFGQRIYPGYGLTEASPVVTTTLLCDRLKPGSVGLPLAGIDVRVVDGDGTDACPGDAGEVWVRGENVFGGYWEDEEATSAVLTADGWLRTGDVGVCDDDGELFIVDRAKDLIIVSGFNVFPAEVEEVIRLHPDVADVAVVGAPNVLTGEEVRAKVVMRRGSAATPEEIAKHCARHLAGYKCPAAVEVVEALPRGLVGKILRRALR